MTKCKECNSIISYMKYYCSKCKKKLAGLKPNKSRDLCSGCRQDYYNNRYKDGNPFGNKGCMSFKNSKVIIKDVYYSLSQIIPNPRWKLNCFNYKRN